MTLQLGNALSNYNKAVYITAVTSILSAYKKVATLQLGNALSNYSKAVYITARN